MGRLIDRERRARAKEAKQQRMKDIREEAVRSFVYHLARHGSIPAPSA